MKTSGSSELLRYVNAQFPHRPVLLTYAQRLYSERYSSIRFHALTRDNLNADGSARLSRFCILIQYTKRLQQNISIESP